MRALTTDFTMFNSADDGDTTHYGGYAMIGEKRINGYGNDRQIGGVFDDIADEICKQLGVEELDDDVMEIVYQLDTKPLIKKLVVVNGKVKVDEAQLQVRLEAEQQYKFRCMVLDMIDYLDKNGDETTEELYSALDRYVAKGREEL